MTFIVFSTATSTVTGQCAQVTASPLLSLCMIFPLYLAMTDRRKTWYLRVTASCQWRTTDTPSRHMNAECNRWNRWQRTDTYCHRQSMTEVQMPIVTVWSHVDKCWHWRWWHTLNEESFRCRELLAIQLRPDLRGMTFIMFFATTSIVTELCLWATLSLLLPLRMIFPGHRISPWLTEALKE